MTPFEKFEFEVEKIRKHFAEERNSFLEKLSQQEKKQIDQLTEELRSKTKRCRHEYVIAERINWHSLDSVQVSQCKICGKIK